MPSRFVCTVKKAFDNFDVGGEAILSADGFAKMTQKKPGFVELKFEEKDDGKRVTADGKPYVEPKAPDAPKAAADAPKK